MSVDNSDTSFWSSLAPDLALRPPPLVATIAALLGDDDREPFGSVGAQALEFCRAHRDASPAALVELFESRSLPRRPDPPPDVPPEPLDESRIADMLGPAGEFADVLPGYECREGQVQMAVAVARALNQSHHLMAEGGTGIGKSLAYLVPSVLWAVQNRMPVVVSTNTKNLQFQLFHKDLPVIRQALGIEFNAALIKGRLNYLCLRKFLRAVAEADVLMPSERRRMVELLCWAVETATGDLSECSAWTPATAASLSSLVTATGEECLSRACRHARRCFLLRARAASLGADVVVANHALVFSEMGIPSPALPPYAQVVFDEAHNLEESATRHFSVELSRPGLRFELGRLWRRGPTRDGLGVVPALLRQFKGGALPRDGDQAQEVERQCCAVIDAVRRVEAAGTPFFTALGGLLGNRSEAIRFDEASRTGGDWQAALTCRDSLDCALGEMLEDLQRLIQSLRGLDSDGLPFHAESMHDIEALVARIGEWRRNLDYVMRGDDPDCVYWVEPALRRKGDACAVAAPVRVGPRLAEALYAQKDCIVFSSATLSVAGSCAFLRDRIGLSELPSDALREISAPSPFDYGSQCLVLVPMFLKDPNEHDGSYAEALASLLSDVFRETHGRGMVLFTSYNMLQGTSRALEPTLASRGIRTLTQGQSGSREAITQAFTEDLSSVLLGTHSFWEGVDAVGETLSCLVVARLPFGVHTEPITAARCEQIERDGGNAFSGYSLPSAVIRFRQGFGRLIRHRSDRGIVIVADRRIFTKRYGGWFQRSLPARSVAVETHEELLAAVTSFLGAP